jgi:predicted Zn-dependent peptidase
VAFAIASASAIAGGGAGCGGASAGKGADAPSAAVKIPLEVYDYTLPNGLRVILDEDRSAPVVAVEVRYKVGSKDDPAGRGGFAHLFEHLMFQGTHSIPGDVFSAMKQAGATDINASTNRDRTEYHETVPSGALEWALWFESERLATMGERLDQVTLDRERSVVKNELRQRYENREGGYFFAIRSRAFFGHDHPYGHLPIGTAAELDAASLADVRAFHERFYRPSSAVVSLVGDFDRNRAGAWIAKYFGAIADAPPKPIRRAPPIVLHGERRIVIEADVPYPSLTVSYPAPPDGSPELAAIGAVGGHIASALDYWLIEERKYARDVGWSITTGMLGSMAEFHVKLNRDADPEEALRVLDKAIFDEPPRRFGSMNATLNRMKIEHLFDYEPFGDRAEMYAHYDDLTQNPLFVARELEAIHRTGRAEAFEARERYLQNKNRLVTVVRRTSSAPLGGRLVEGG